MAEFITSIRTTEGDKKYDYNALGNLPDPVKFPDCANALKGVASGEVVRVDDVSPIEHTIKARVHGKNLIDLSTAKPMLDETIMVDGDYLIFKNFGGVRGYGCTFEGLPLSVGKTYTFSVRSVTLTSANFGWLVVYEDGTREPTNNSKTLTVTIKKEVIRVNFYIAFGDLNTVQDIAIGEPMCEEGEAVTEYVPYVDPSTFTVTRCGKNLIETNEFEMERTEPWASADIGKVKIAPGNYVISCNFNQVGTDLSTVALSARGYDDHLVILGTSSSAEATGKLVVPFTINEGEKGFQIYLYSNMTAESLSSKCIFTNIMAEAGDVVTEFEAYKGETYTPNADGACDVVSVSPNMTLFADTDNIDIVCEYNRDTNSIAKSVPLVDRTTGTIYSLYISDGKVLIEERGV